MYVMSRLLLMCILCLFINSNVKLFSGCSWWQYFNGKKGFLIHYFSYFQAETENEEKVAKRLRHLELTAQLTRELMPILLEVSVCHRSRLTAL